jgi:predicted Zn-dependent protease
VSVFQRAQQEALLGRHADAMREARSLQKTFPGAPGGAIIACLVDGQQKPAGEARKSCESARSAAPEAFLPRYVLGLLHCAEGHLADARHEFESALALEDSTTSAWASLAAVYDQLGDGASAKALAARYRARFHSALRPAIWPAGWPHPAVEITSLPRR